MILIKGHMGKRMFLNNKINSTYDFNDGAYGKYDLFN